MNIHAIYRRVSTPFRRKRMQAFEREFLNQPVDAVLDIGGTPGNWSFVKSVPNVVLLNIYPSLDTSDPRFTYIQGDGCNIPFPDEEFDVVFSNSVIEHLGTWERQVAFANEVRRVGRSYYVQTPNRWFPIEPHYLTPFVHYFPANLRGKILRNGTVWGWLTRPSQAKCEAMIEEIQLLTAQELSELFPEAQIERERVLGLTKSLIAVSSSIPECGDAERDEH